MKNLVLSYLQSPVSASYLVDVLSFDFDVNKTSLRSKICAHSLQYQFKYNLVPYLTFVL